MGLFGLFSAVFVGSVFVHDTIKNTKNNESYRQEAILSGKRYYKSDDGSYRSIHDNGECYLSPEENGGVYIRRVDNDMIIQVLKEPNKKNSSIDEYINKQKVIFEKSTVENKTKALENGDLLYEYQGYDKRNNIIKYDIHTVTERRTYANTHSLEDFTFLVDYKTGTMVNYFACDKYHNKLKKADEKPYACQYMRIVPAIKAYEHYYGNVLRTNYYLNNSTELRNIDKGDGFNASEIHDFVNEFYDIIPHEELTFEEFMLKYYRGFDAKEFIEWKQQYFHIELSMDWFEFRVASKKSPLDKIMVEPVNDNLLLLYSVEYKNGRW